MRSVRTKHVFKYIFHKKAQGVTVPQFSSNFVCLFIFGGFQRWLSICHQRKRCCFNSETIKWCGWNNYTAQSFTEGFWRGSVLNLVSCCSEARQRWGRWAEFKVPEVTRSSTHNLSADLLWFDLEQVQFQNETQIINLYKAKWGRFEESGLGSGTSGLDLSLKLACMMGSLVSFCLMRPTSQPSTHSHLLRTI